MASLGTRPWKLWPRLLVFYDLGLEPNETYLTSLLRKELSFEDMESGFLKDGGIAEVPVAKKKATAAARLRSFMMVW